MLYKFIRKILFYFDAESVHHFSMNIFSTLCDTALGRWIMRRLFRAPALPVHFMGVDWRNPVGLAAGFDKNAAHLEALETLGFGFVEIGTVTPKAQTGNDRPRLFRLPEDKAIINRMGFNNEGVEAVVSRLRDWREKERRLPEPRMRIGGNIGKNKITPNDEAWKDYELCFRELFHWVDYFVVNVSSPNTPGLRELQEKESLRKILSHLQTLNANQAIPKPLFLKIAPDLSQEQIDDVIDLALEIHLDGLVVSNTTISRIGLKASEEHITSIGAGGLSGKPVSQRATDIVTYINEKTNNKIPIIASGGIFNAADAKEKMKAGATLVQVWTGFIYEGPSIVKNICKGLSQKTPN